ncbi:PilW family protein [Crocosphaera watsonii]|uniref:Uncharacterized protein n=3 Tax=Crocosphaera watsonii TaxID=263511 RepID=G5JB50_CROWT|nr:hypothetical protein [Crocosphaera watsonii]EHJ10553.1 hypothetical protein CWATWH0003_4662 [Crocosphaera watsonii WH 0003]
MKNKYTKFKPHLLALDRPNQGITLMELLTGTMVSSIIINLGFMGFSLSRQMYLQEQQTNDVNQALRIVFEMVGADIRQAGEGFAEDPNFPSVVVTKDDDGNSEISIRRSVLSISLPVCRRVVSGTTEEVMVVDETGSIAGCDVIEKDNGWPDSLDSWRDYRTSNGSTVRAFIYDGVGNGEFFDYAGEKTFAEDGSTVTPSPDAVASASITTDRHRWENTYEANGSSRIYLIEERHYRLENNRLQLTLDNNPDDTSTIVGNLETFQIITHIQQDLSATSSQRYTCTVIPPQKSTDCNVTLPNDYVWSQIKFLEIKSKVLINDSSSFALETEQSQKVFPRNILNY